MILCLGSGDVELRVVPPSTSHDVGLCGRSGERIDEIAQYAGDAKTVGVGRWGSDVFAGEAVVDAVESHPDWELGHTERQSNDPVEAGSLSATQLPDRYGRASPDPKGVGLLTIGLARKHD